MRKTRRRWYSTRAARPVAVVRRVAGNERATTHAIELPVDRGDRLVVPLSGARPREFVRRLVAGALGRSPSAHGSSTTLAAALGVPTAELALDRLPAQVVSTGAAHLMVVKPLDFIVRGSRGLVQPAVKCRGPEYLRIIYGPEYTVPENLDRLRSRGLGVKRSLALREFALGVEGLERFVRREPLRRVHECVFGVLALESEPVDPRL